MALRLPSNPLEPTGVLKYEKASPAHDNRFLHKEIPTHDEWRALTGVRPGFGVAPLTDLEERIRDAITHFDEVGVADQFAYFDSLRRLYDLVDQWLTAPRQREVIRPHVQKLFEAVVYRLCEFFSVSVNALPHKLQQAHKHMEYNHHGEHYIEAEKLEKHRLIIAGGQVTQWSDAHKWDAPVSTASPLLRSEGGDDIPQACWCDAGFVMSVWDQFYMAKHDPQANRFHSQYMRGGRVLCAGEMTIANGVVQKVSNASGHYRPRARQLLPVLWKLMMGGVNLNNVRACVRENDDFFVCRASDFLGRMAVCLSTANPRPPEIIARFHFDGHGWAPT